MQGRSGGIVGTLKNNSDKVLKIHLIKKHKVDDLLKCEIDNINIDYRFNEVIINYLLSNLQYVKNINKTDLNYVNQFLIKLSDFGFSDNAIYFVNDKVGVEYEKLDHSKGYITNLNDLFNENHIHFLNKAVNENNTEVIKMYDLFLTEKFEEFIKAVSILQKHFDYINSDSKLNNIFIKKDTNKTPKFKILKDYGLIIDFKLLYTKIKLNNNEKNSNKNKVGHFTDMNSLVEK
jgi:hypothetical protein